MAAPQIDTPAAAAKPVRGPILIPDSAPVTFGPNLIGQLPNPKQSEAKKPFGKKVYVHSEAGVLFPLFFQTSMVLVALKTLVFGRPSGETAPLLGAGGSTPDMESQSNSSSPNSSSGSRSNKTQSVVQQWIESVDPRVMSDLIIGLSDGLTVPFALTAGLSSLGDTKLVITGGMAELVSGAISMGLGGYLAAKSESEYYHTQVRKEKQLYFENEESIENELFDIVMDMGASEQTAELFIGDLAKNPKSMIDFIIRFGKGLEEPPEGRIVNSALTIGAGYFFGGFVPLLPYFFVHTVGAGLQISVAVMLFTLFWFGYIKSLISMGEECTQWTRVNEGIQMVLIGSIAAGSAWSLVYLIE